MREGTELDSAGVRWRACRLVAKPRVPVGRRTREGMQSRFDLPIGNVPWQGGARTTIVLPFSLFPPRYFCHFCFFTTYLLLCLLWGRNNIQSQCRKSNSRAAALKWSSSRRALRGSTCSRSQARRRLRPSSRRTTAALEAEESLTSG